MITKKIEEKSTNRHSVLADVRRMYAKKIRKVSKINSTPKILKREKRKMLDALCTMHKNGLVQNLDYFWDINITPFFAYYA